MLKITAEKGAVLLPVKIVPGASRTRYLGEWQGRARIAVAAAPEKGKANAALAEFLAEQLGVSKRSVTVVAGATTPLKTVRIEGASLDAVRAAFEKLTKQMNSA